MLLLLPMSSAASETASESEPATAPEGDETATVSSSSPLVIIGAAFVAGIAVARWLDWRERARAAA